MWKAYRRRHHHQKMGITSRNSLLLLWTDTPELDQSVQQVYTSVGDLLHRYRSGKVPKAFKVIPRLRNWEEVLALTDPEVTLATAFRSIDRVRHALLIVLGPTGRGKKASPSVMFFFFETEVFNGIHIYIYIYIYIYALPLVSSNSVGVFPATPLCPSPD